MSTENLEYLNLNSLRKYPIREGLSATDVTGVFTIPDDFIVDLQIAATTDVTQRFYISGLFNQLTSIIVQISDFSSTVVGTFTIDVSSFTTYNTYTMVTSPGTYLNANGRITISDVALISNSPSGNYSFATTATELEPKTIIPGLNGINSLTFTDASGIQYTLSGNVQIIARSNLRFTYDSGTNTLTLDAGNGLGLNETCTETNCVQRINGVVPDSNGNISFLGVGCTAISAPSANTLQVNDTCCTPCSGCEDLTTLTQRVTTVENSYLSLKSFYSYLQTELTQYLTTVNSAGCVCS